MISAVFTNRLLKSKAILFLILTSTAIRVILAPEIFPFDFDQVQPAKAAYAFFVDHKISFVGQELSFFGFFLGPLHYLVQFIPYGLCGLAPDCVPYFYIAISALTLFITYIALKEIFSRKIAIVVSIIYAFSFAQIISEIGVNSNYFLPLASVGLLWCMYKYFHGKNQFLVLGAFVAGIATVNFNPIFIFSALAAFAASLLRKKRSPFLYFAAICAFLINVLPLLIFNFRHENLLGNALVKFSGENTKLLPELEDLIFVVWHIQIPYYTNFLFQKTQTIFLLTTSALLLAGILYSVRKGSNLLSYLSIWVLFVTLGFVFYNGHIPDYYFLQSILPFLILTAHILTKNKILLSSFLVLFFFLNINRIVRYESAVNYKIKKSVVNYIIADAKNKTFNVYYDFPPGIGVGYDYLFKSKNRLPQEGGTNLYILKFKDPTYFFISPYKMIFPEKNVNFTTIGFVNIVSIK